MPMISCDEVFELLTRSPVRGGQPSDDGLEQHLAVCHDCRHLAETLRPATRLFQEVLDHECLVRTESPSWPVPAGDPISLERHTCHVVPLLFAGGFDGSSGRSGVCVRWAVAAAVVLVLAVWAGLGRGAHGTASPHDRDLASALTAHQTSNVCGIAARQLPGDCLAALRAQQDLPVTIRRPLPVRQANLMATCQRCHEHVTQPAFQVALHGCTTCHAAWHTADADPDPDLMRRLAQSCDGCHAGLES